MEFRKMFFLAFPYCSYIYDLINNSKLNNYFHNFWNSYRDDFWIPPFIDSRNINKKNKKIDYVSVMWPRNVVKYLKNTTIFYTLEDIWKWSIHELSDYEDYLINDVDLSIWFREYNNENYFRFPLWISQLIDPWMKYDDIKKRIDGINSNRNVIKKDKFCTLISRWDKNWERLKVYNSLLKFWNIDCPSFFKHNIDVELPDYESKRKFMEDYRFNICLENHSVKWYVTEKLIDAFRSKCIPIYNWILTEFDKRIINEKAIINIHSPDWLEKVKEIQSNDEKYKEFISIKPFNDESALILNDYLNLFEKRLRTILA